MVEKKILDNKIIKKHRIRFKKERCLKCGIVGDSRYYCKHDDRTCMIHPEIDPKRYHYKKWGKFHLLRFNNAEKGILSGRKIRWIWIVRSSRCWNDSLFCFK